MTLTRFSLLLALIACGDDSTLPILDSGADAGRDVISFDASDEDARAPDAGGEDAGGEDAGSDAALADAGESDAATEACLFSLEDGLSDGCFPACVEGSAAAAAGCFDYDCYLEIFEMGDGTGLMFDAGSMSESLFYRGYLTNVVEATESCHQCETLVTRACEFDFCPDESTAFFNCLRGLDGGGSCFPLSMEVFDCANSPTNQNNFYRCYDAGLARCLQ